MKAYQSCAVQPSQCHCTLAVQPFPSLPFSLLFLLLLAHFYLGKVLNILCYKLFRDNAFISKLSNSLTVTHPCPFSSFHCAITCHAINCFVRRCLYVSNTSGQLFSLPVIFVLEEVGGEPDAFVKVFVKGHALIQSGKWEGHNSQLTPPPHPSPQ